LLIVFYAANFVVSNLRTGFYKRKKKKEKRREKKEERRKKE